MVFINNTVFFIFFILTTLSNTVFASGLGACIRRPKTPGITAGDLYTILIANGMGIAQSYGEKKDSPCMYYYDMLRECDPQNWFARYDTQGNAQISFVIKDKGRPGELLGPIRKRCNIKNIIGYATDGAFEPECPVGETLELAAQWAKARRVQLPPPKKFSFDSWLG